MKKYIYIALAALLTASCSQMDELAPQGGSALTSQVLQTNQAVPSRVNATFNGMYTKLGAPESVFGGGRPDDWGCKPPPSLPDWPGSFCAKGLGGAGSLVGGGGRCPRVAGPGSLAPRQLLQSHLLRLDAGTGDRETGPVLFVSLSCVAPAAAEGQFQGNTAVFPPAERRQNESRAHCLGSWPCLRGLLTCSELGPGGLSREETVVGGLQA